MIGCERCERVRALALDALGAEVPLDPEVVLDIVGDDLDAFEESQHFAASTQEAERG